MSVHDAAAWSAARARLAARGLWGEGASLSLRCADRAACWWGEGDGEPVCIALDAAPPEAAGHAAVHAGRPDAGAVAWVGGAAGRALAAAGEPMPQVFDEQARHLGGFVVAGAGPKGRADALARHGQWLSIDRRPVVLGMTVQRLVLNAELAEKCATAWLLAHAAADAPRVLPWWVRRIANGRLRRDERRAAACFSRGRLPQDSQGY